MPSEYLTTRSSCRVCGESELYPVLDMGEVPPANGFVDDAETDEVLFPLEVVSCRSCSHVQLKHTVSREFLFSDYPYFASSSGSIPEHFRAYGEMLERRYLDEGDLAVDIGSNDGGLLAGLSEGVRRLGVEPAENVAAAAEERGVPTETEFFDPETARRLRDEYGPADVICANNVLGHIDDLRGFLEGIDELLAEEGAFVVEVPYLVDLVTEAQFTTIYHEHISYFSIRSFSALVEPYGMAIADVERLDRHGGSIRVHVRRQQSEATVSEYVEDLRALERARGLGETETLDRFAERVRQKKDALRQLLFELTEDGASVVGYGASAKGNVLLNYCDIGPDRIDYIIDEMEAKQGTYSPGMNVPVRSPDAFREDDPDYALLLAWNYWDLIREKESEYLDDGGRFVVPTPLPDVRNE